MNKIMPSPFEIHFEIERQCGLSCKHCSSSNIRSNQIRGYDNNDIKAMLSLLSDYDLYVFLTGGEPLLCEDLENIITATKENNSTKIGLFTTGLLLKSTLSENFAKKLFGLGVSIYYISVYSDDENLHDLMTQLKGSHASTRNTIETLVSLGADVRFNTVVYKNNENRLDKILKYANKLGISEVRFLKLVMHGDASTNWDELAPTLSMVNIFEELEKLKSSMRITISSSPEFVPCRPFHSSLGCQAGKRLLYVGYDGFIYPCACTKNSLDSRICHITDVQKIKSYIDEISVNPHFMCLGASL